MMELKSWLKLLALIGVLLVANDALGQRRPRQQRRPGQVGGERGRQVRDDSLQVGELAPTFILKSLDGESETDLAEFRGERPVVLFFGSYS